LIAVSDIQNIRLLWLKCGLFLFLGCLAALLIIIRLDSVAEVFLLGISIWAFCRCYYFAFYVIEKYVDSRFRFSGLYSFAKYAVLGVPPNAPEPAPIPDKPRNAGNLNQICVHWLVGIAISNVAIPMVYPLVQDFLNLGSVNEFFVETIWIAWLVAQLAFVVTLGALSNAPLPFRWPVSLGAVLILVVPLAIGIAPRNTYGPELVTPLLFATACFFFGIVGLSTLRWLGKVHLTNATASGVEKSDETGHVKNQEQLSIRFLLATTAAVAITASVLMRVSFPSDANRIAMMFWGGGIYAFLLLLITISLIHFPLSRNSRTRKWSAITTLILLVVSPFLAIRLAANFNAYGPHDAIDYAYSYVFFASYLGFLGFLFLQLRKLGYQLYYFVSRKK